MFAVSVLITIIYRTYIRYYPGSLTGIDGGEQWLRHDHGD